MGGAGRKGIGGSREGNEPVFSDPCTTFSLMILFHPPLSWP